jgi:hypothetical protein
MVWTSLARLPRTLAVVLALAANLVAAGVPVLHAVAHEVAEGHRPDPEAAALAQIDHGHDEVHPASLHEERAPIKRPTLDFSFVLPDEAQKPVAFAAPATTRHRPVLRVISRAPPRTDPARAPPLA